MEQSLDFAARLWYNGANKTERVLKMELEKLAAADFDGVYDEMEKNFIKEVYSSFTISPVW